MRRLALDSQGKGMLVSVGLGVVVFLAAYLGWAFYETSLRFTGVLSLSERQAHTIVGKEGYEYIFDPTTQVYIDRIKPNSTAIVTYIVLKNYLPSLRGRECTFPDPEACLWITHNLHFGQDQRAERGDMILYASLLGLVSAGVAYLLIKPVG